MATKPPLVSDRVHLILNYRPLGLVRATALDIDSDVLTVDTGCILLPPGADVEVTCAYRHDGDNRVHRLSGRIITAQPHATRLHFEADDPDTMAFVHRLRERVRPPRDMAGLFLRSPIPQPTTAASS